MELGAWRDVVDKYHKVKTLYIEGEEYDPKLKLNLQPLNELRNALDHVFRVITLELKREINGDSPELKNSIEIQFHELNRHLTLAFYDVCDYLSLAYRNRIYDILKAYSPKVIKNAFPAYYRDMRARIEEINGKFALLRAKRTEFDSSDDEEFYENLLDLRKYYKAILEGTPTLEDFQEEEEREAAQRDKDRKEARFWGAGGWVLNVVIAILSALIGYLIK